MNGDGHQDLHFRLDGSDAPVTARVHLLPGGGARLNLPTGAVRAELRDDALLLDGVSRRVRVVRQGDTLTVIHGGRTWVLHRLDPLAPPRTEAAGSSRVTAPISGRVARVLVGVGDAVERNAPLLVIETMKVEMTLRAPAAGTVAAVLHGAEDIVEEGAELVTFVRA